MIALIIATRNAHKIQEIRAILGESFQYFTLNNFPTAPQTVEDADTFAGNATKKAVELARWLSRSDHSNLATRNWQLYVLADDSGLEVDALDGAPGVHSARFAALDEKGSELPASAARNTPDAANNSKLLRLLADLSPDKRTARFRCVLALTPVLCESARAASPTCYADELELETEIFEGVCEGCIDSTPRGEGGFGYDPLFIPVGYQQSFAEMGEEVKNRLSHRANALDRLRKRLLK